MKPAYLFIFFVTLITSVCFADEGKVDNKHYTNAIVYKAGDKENQIWLQFLRLGDDCNLTDRNIKFSSARKIKIKAFQGLWKGIASIPDFQKHELDGFVEGLDLNKVHFIVTFQRTKATGRHEKTRRFAIPLKGTSDEFLQWLTKLKKLNGEQVAAPDGE